MRGKFLPFHVPDIGESEIQAVSETLRSGWLTTGPRVKEFEKDFEKYLGVDHAIAVNSCTSALHLALDAVGVREGDEVIVPTMTFAATAGVVLHLGAKPVLVDCKPDNFNIDPSKIQKAITPKTKAIIPVHMAGQSCNMDQISEIAREYNLKIIEDAAHALPARYKKRMVGTIGDISCFSFYATKTITTGEGGMIATDNPEYAKRMRMMSLHGISKDAWMRYTSEGSWYYEISLPGYKYNMTDISAAIGIHQLKKCDQFAGIRKRYADLYTEGLQNIQGVQVPEVDPDCEHAWHLYTIQVQHEKLNVSRNDIIEMLREANIGASVHFIPLHMHPYYCEEFDCRPEQFPVATLLYEGIISLPIYPKMTEMDIQYVITSLKKIFQAHQA